MEVLRKSLGKFPKKRKHGNEESRLQQACVRWFRLQYPKYAGLLFAVPNGGVRDAVTGAILKAEGALAGVADLLLLVPTESFHGLCVEMKTQTGRQSESQKSFQEKVSAMGYKYVICRSIEEFVSEITLYLEKVSFRISFVQKKFDAKKVSTSEKSL